eukprot:TRINITY_DN15164_c0_g2_i4.p2 TRINITY_DN15164_c0_g2~~TRINITY_DN15164_c0_g2_i4.p2  ORF type:complete len:163 (-),score=71.92 TRINITY_DN15164_c0_g2_i4:1486-1974(-)
MELLEKAAANPEKLNLEGMSYDELTELKKNIDGEINFLSNSFDQLRLAATKFSAAKEKLEVFAPEANDKEILVPLTTSVFIPGTLKSVDKIMFEVGASYYVEDTVPQAKEFYGRKVEGIKKNMVLISKIIENKSKQQQEVMLTIQELVMKAREEYMASQTRQ